MADRLLDALVPYATPGFAQYRLPGRTSASGALSDGLEGFARSFLLASFRIAGADGAVDPRLIQRYAQGLTTGSDPAGAEAWPQVAERAQPMVEAASIAIGLHETRPWIWDRLDDTVRGRIVDWFSAFIGKHTVDNNWRLFQVISEQFLASVGAPYSQADIDGGLDRIEDWYIGDGWYTDGDGKKFDYYNGWALHLYPLMWARIAGESADGGRVKLYRDRLRQFLSGYQHFFGSDGAPVHQGRSLTYRFAAVTPLWMGALADTSPLDAGLTRRLASGALKHFAEHGAPDARGVLPLGWHRPFLPVTQNYSGPASPYWASKGFLGLLLPPGHEVWTTCELPLPVEQSDQYVALPAIGWLLHGTQADGIVRLLNHGSDGNGPEPSAQPHDDPHYSKLAYSSSSAPESEPRAWHERIDNDIALVTAGGTPSRRSFIHPAGVTESRAHSWHMARLPHDGAEYRIETTSLPRGPWEFRVHRVEAPQGVTVRDGGYAIAGDRPPHASTGTGWAQVRREDGLSSTVIALHGWDTARVVHRTDTNAFGPHSGTPFLTSAPHPGGRSVHVSLIALTGGPVDPAELYEGIAVEVVDDEVIIGLPDGSQLRA